MPGLLELRGAVTLALHAAVFLASHPERLVSTKNMAQQMSVSEAHLAKVLQRLSKCGIVSAIRGPRGGFRLAKRSDQITLREVYETIEGPIIPHSCLFGTPVCRGNGCILGNVLREADHNFRDRLSRRRLSDLTHVFGSHEGQDKSFPGERGEAYEVPRSGYALLGT